MEGLHSFWKCCLQKMASILSRRQCVTREYPRKKTIFILNREPINAVYSTMTRKTSFNHDMSSN